MPTKSSSTLPLVIFMMIPNTAKALMAIFCLFHVSYGFAGELILTNGDRLEGVLLNVGEDSVTWSSSSFGEVTIARDKVAKLNTEGELSIEGIESSCQSVKLEDEMMSYNCQDGSEASLSFASVASIQPYVDPSIVPRSYTGKATLGLLMSRGNSVKDEFEAASQVTYRVGDLRNVMDIYVENKAVSNVTTENKNALGYRLDWFFNDRGFWYNQIGVSNDEAKRIDQRYAYGSGAGYQVWDQADIALALELGINYEKEKITPDLTLEPELQFGEIKERTGVRLGVNYMYMLPYSAKFEHESELLSSVDNPDDWRFSSDFVISLPIAGRLISEYAIGYDYDNNPAEGTHKKDVRTTVGIGYEW